MTTTEAIQTALKSGGFYGGKVDGIIGPITKQAVANWLQSPSGPAVELKPLIINGGVTRTDWRGFVPVDGKKLAAALPSMAKQLVPSFLKWAEQFNLNPLFLVAISKHETGNWTSNVFKHKGNAMGISNTRSAVSVSSYDESIRIAAKSLGRPHGLYSHCKTIADVASVYAPVPHVGTVANDPRNLNRHWPVSVAKFFAELEQAVA